MNTDYFVQQNPSGFRRRIAVDPNGRRIFLAVHWSWSKGRTARVYHATAYDNPGYERWTSNVFPSNHRQGYRDSFASSDDPRHFLTHLGLSEKQAESVVAQWHIQGDWLASGESQYSYATECRAFLPAGPHEHPTREQQAIDLLRRLVRKGKKGEPSVVADFEAAAAALALLDNCG